WIHAMSRGAGGTSNALATGSWFGKVWMTRTAQTATASTGWSDITGTGSTALPAFDPANHTSNAWISGVAVNPLDDHEAWVTIGRLNGGRIYHTTTAGGLPSTTWTDISTTLPPNLVVDTITVDPLKPQNLWHRAADGERHRRGRRLRDRQLFDRRALSLNEFCARSRHKLRD